MTEYRFSVTRIFPRKDRIFDSVCIRENAAQRKAMFWHVLHSENFSISSIDSSKVSSIFFNLRTITILSITATDGLETLSTAIALFSISRIKVELLVLTN